MRIIDLSSDERSSDLHHQADHRQPEVEPRVAGTGKVHCQSTEDRAVTDAVEGGVEKRPEAVLLPGQPGHVPVEQVRRSEERRVGKECVRTCSSRWSTSQSQKQTTEHDIDDTHTMI